MAIHAPITRAALRAPEFRQLDLEDQARALVKVPRARLEALATLFIAALDLVDGDPDIEANGDEQDGSFTEDDFCRHWAVETGAGCPISDPGGNDEGI